METVYKDVQISQVSKHLNIPKVVVRDIFTTYVNYLKDKLSRGETIKFLNVCYLKVGGKDESVHETIAYVANEIGQKLGHSQTTVYRVLMAYEDFLIRDLRKLYSYSIRGLIRIRLEKDYNGNYKVRTKKSTAYEGYDIYVTTTGYFKRKVEVTT